MTAVRKIDMISVDDYLAGELQTEIRHEYLGGYVYAMAGLKNVHTLIATAFCSLVHAKLRGKPCEVFNSDAKVRVRFPNHTRFYYPDGMVVCQSNSANETFQDNPVILAEVISESTRRTDEGEKRDAYLTIPTLSAYLLIETDRPRVVVHLRTDNGFVAQLYEGADAMIRLDAIDADVRLAELYERVDFQAAQQH